MNNTNTNKGKNSSDLSNRPIISKQDVRYQDELIEKNFKKSIDIMYNKFLNADFKYYDSSNVYDILHELKKNTINIDYICNKLLMIYSKMFKNKDNNKRFIDAFKNKIKLINLSGLSLQILIEKYTFSHKVLNEEYQRIESEKYDSYDERYDREEEERYERERELCEEYGTESYAHACYMRDRARAKYGMYNSDSDSDYDSDY